LQDVFEHRTIQLPDVDVKVLQPSSDRGDARLGFRVTWDERRDLTQSNRVGLQNANDDPHPIGQLVDVRDADQRVDSMNQSVIQFVTVAHVWGSFGRQITEVCLNMGNNATSLNV
jgi:hypothetical protein